MLQRATRIEIAGPSGQASLFEGDDCAGLANHQLAEWQKSMGEEEIHLLPFMASFGIVVDYNGHYEIRPSQKHGKPDLLAHIRNTLLLHSGQSFPDWAGEEERERMRALYKEQGVDEYAARLLDVIDVGQAEQPRRGRAR